MSANFTYQGFGLVIQSEFEIFQLQSEHNKTKADIRIIKGSVTAQGIDPKANPNEVYQCLNNDFWINVEGIVRFLVSDGKTITVDVAEGADMQTVKLYLLGSGIGAILQQRGSLVLHGNAIRFGDSAVIVVAQSGIGKSTLAAEFFRRGHQLLADDVCAIDHEGYVHPSYPYIKLWKNTLDNIKLEPREAIQITLQKDKYYYPINDAFCSKKLKIKAIYVLNKADTDHLTIFELNGINKLKALQNNKYRPQFSDKMNIIHEHILHFADILKVINVTRLIRPKKGFTVNEIAQHIANDMDGTP